MKLKDLKEKITFEKIIYIFWGIYILSLMLSSTSIALSNGTFNTALKIIRYICYIFFSIKVINDWKNGAKITLTFIMMMLLAGIIFISSKNIEIVFTILVLFSLRKLEFDKLIKIALNIIFITYFIIVSLAILSIVPDWVYYREKVARHSLGFRYATDAIGIYLSIILMYFYLRRNKATKYEIFVLEVINILLYGYTDGRTSFILISLVLLMLALSKVNCIKKFFYKIKVQKVLKFICYTLPIILFIIFHIMVYLFSVKNNIAIKFDDMITGRVKYAQEAYKNYNVNLFGKKIKWYRLGRIRFCRFRRKTEF